MRWGLGVLRRERRVRVRVLVGRCLAMERGGSMRAVPRKTDSQRRGGRTTMGCSLSPRGSSREAEGMRAGKRASGGRQHCLERPSHGATRTPFVHVHRALPSAHDCNFGSVCSELGSRVLWIGGRRQGRVTSRARCGCVRVDLEYPSSSLRRAAAMGKESWPYLPRPRPGGAKKTPSESTCMKGGA